MFQEINQKLMKLNESKREQQRVLNLLRLAKMQIESEEQKSSTLKKTLEKELKDVKLLETVSLHSLFYSILGNKDQKLQKENTEYLAAKLKFDESINSIQLLNKEIEAYDQRLSDYKFVDTEMNQMLEYKKNLIIQENDNTSQELINMGKRNSELKQDIKEFTEAICAGNEALDSLQRVSKLLGSAENWGTLDLFGGGMITTAIKHSEIDKARDEVTKAQSLLNRFQRELSDVNFSESISIEINSFDTFADYFFDGLIFDWNVQSKIEESLKSVNITINKVENTMNVLENKEKELQTESERLVRDINGLINDGNCSKINYREYCNDLLH